jgi:hypothetical protein
MTGGGWKNIRTHYLRNLSMLFFWVLKMETVCFCETLVSKSTHSIATQKNIDNARMSYKERKTQLAFTMHMFK